MPSDEQHNEINTINLGFGPYLSSMCAVLTKRFICLMYIRRGLCEGQESELLLCIYF